MGRAAQARHGIDRPGRLLGWAWAQGTAQPAWAHNSKKRAISVVCTPRKWNNLESCKLDNGQHQYGMLSLIGYWFSLYMLLKTMDHLKHPYAWSDATEAFPMQDPVYVRRLQWNMEKHAGSWNLSSNTLNKWRRKAETMWRHLIWCDKMWRRLIWCDIH